MQSLHITVQPISFRSGPQPYAVSSVSFASNLSLPKPKSTSRQPLTSRGLIILDISRKMGKGALTSPHHCPLSCMYLVSISTLNLPSPVHCAGNSRAALTVSGRRSPRESISTRDLSGYRLTRPRTHCLPVFVLMFFLPHRFLPHF